MVGYEERMSCERICLYMPVALPSSSAASLGALRSSSLSIMFTKRLPFLIFALLFSGISAQIAIPRSSDCFTGNASLKLDVSTIYAQITTSEALGRHLNLVLLGQSPQVIQGTSNGSSDLGLCQPFTLLVLVRY